MTTVTQKEENERQKQAVADLASLSRVSHKLAMTDAGPPLETVLGLLLPRLLKRIGTNHLAQQQGSPDAIFSKIHAKLVEMLSHTMKRVRADADCKLPCSAILQLLLLDNEQLPNPAVDPFTLNLALAFLTLGLPRCAKDETEALLPGLLLLLPVHSGIDSLQSGARKSQSHQLAHLILAVLERVVMEDDRLPSVKSLMPPSLYTLAGNIMDKGPSSIHSTSLTVMDSVREICQQEIVAAALYELLLDALMYQPSPSKTMPPAGLSQAGHERLIAGTNWAAEMAPQSRLKAFKVAILTMVAPTRRWAILMSSTALGTSRTVALLVAAAGDAHPDVADRAKLYLNAHLDGTRTKLSKDQAVDSGLGNVLSLTCALLSLPLGSTNAESTLHKIPAIATLGMTTPPIRQVQSAQQQLILSLKRRLASDKTSAAVLSFVAKILDESPHFLDEPEAAQAVGSLSVLAAAKLLGSTTSTSGFSLLRAAPYIAAAQLLNALSARSSSSLDVSAKALSTACSVLSQASTPRPTLSQNEGSIAIRDACYGVVCNLSRSSNFCKEGYIFGCGQPSPSTTVQMATLLFGCATNEDEALRPRAVAALDALLGAYSRLYQEGEDDVVMEMDLPPVSNPWMIAVSDVHIAKKAKAAATNLDKNGLAKAILPLLWSGAQSTNAKASRIAAARWASDLLTTLDLPNACHILCFLAGDSDVTASAIAREGLSLTKKIGDTFDEIATNDLKLPDFAEITTVIFHRSSGTASTWRPRYYDFSYLGKAAALRFGLVCLLHDLYGGEDDAVREYFRALADTLALFNSASAGKGSAHGRDSIDLLDECAICFAGCTSTSAFARSMLVNGQTSFLLEDLEFLAMHGPSSKARRYLAEACGKVYEDATVWSQNGQTPDLSSWLKQNQLPQTLELCANKVAEAQKDVFTLGEVHGAAFLGARCVRALRLHVWDETDTSESLVMETCLKSASSIIEALGKGVSHLDEAIGNAFAECLGIALSYDSIDAPILNPRLYEGIASALVDLELGLKRCGNGDHTDPIRASSLARAAGVALAASTSGAGSTGAASIGSARIQCVDALFELIGSMAFRKDGEIALVAGEALATYADAYSPDNAVWSSSTDVWPEKYSESLYSQLPPHQQVLYALMQRDALASNPHKRTATAPALLAIVGLAARRVNNNSQFSKRALVVEITKRLPSIQQSFITLLAEPRSKQLSRESSCLGLAACQGLAESLAEVHDDGLDNDSGSLRQDLNGRLLRAFGQTSNYGRSAMQETASQNAERLRQNQRTEGGERDASMPESFGIETEVGGAAGLGEAALGAYREMAAAASALGRSDVLYALLLLSVSHPVWFTPGPRDRYSASSLLGENSLVGNRTNAAEMREALRPHLGKLIPRLLRAKNDPNKQTREQMEILWAGLTGGGAESRQAITEHLLPTIDSLIDDAGNRLWRARVGACGALAEVIVGRVWAELGGGGAVLDDDEVMLHTNTASTPAGLRLLRLWRVSMRAIDDVRAAVRESGEALARSVRGLTIRLCDPTRTEIGDDHVSAEINARCAASTSLRWLVQYGLSQAAPEATGLCISCLIGVIEVVKPIILEPSVPDLIGALLMAMSGLEPAALNYLQVRAAGADQYEQLERVRLQIAQSGPIAGALSKCLEMISSVSLTTQQAIIAQLDSALRTGAGFATRAAVADTVSTLCATCPMAFKFPGTSSTNPTVRLLRALYFASERERGQGAKDKMAHALGNLAALAPCQSVRSLALRACDRYARSTGNNDDPSARHASASALRALAVRASHQFADGGPNDIYCRRVLPMAFLGQKDEDTKVASLWKEVWDEGGQASGAMVEGHGVLLEERLLPGLVRASVEALNDLSWIRRVSGAAAMIDLVQLNILAPFDPSNGGSAIGRGAVSRAKQRAEQSSIATKACLDVVMRPRLWTGKNEVVKAMVNIACRWVMVGGIKDHSFHFGCDDVITSSWRPIVWTAPESMHDLFEGDKFFERPANQDACIAKEGVVIEMDVSLTDEQDDDEQDDDAIIDFQEGDMLLDEITDEANRDEMKVKESCGSIVLSGLCKVLLDEALPTGSKPLSLSSAEEILPYKVSALQGLSEILTSLSASESNEHVQEEKRRVYKFIAPVLLPYIDSDYALSTDKMKSSARPPLVVARSIDCLASAIWMGFGADVGDTSEDGLLLAKVFLTIATKQSAWTVREAAVLGTAKLASSCDVRVLRSHETIMVLLDCTTRATQDRKFWRVRLAGLKLLRALILRAGDATSSSSAFAVAQNQPTEGTKNKQLILEALLPSKEQILGIAQSSLNDNESQVTAVATEVCCSLSWWP
jgi:proteasome component ECM29